MRPEKLSELLQNIDEALIARAGANRRKHRRQTVRIIAFAACLALVITGVGYFALTNPLSDDDTPDRYIPFEPDSDSLPDTEKTEDISDSDGSSSVEGDGTIESEPGEQKPPDTQSPDGGDEPAAGDDQNGETPVQLYPVVTPMSKTLGAAQYPAVMQFPTEEEYGNVDGERWWQAYTLWRENAQKAAKLETYPQGNAAYVKKTLQTMLGDSNGENVVYSPSTLYFALGMLAEISGTQTQSEILSLIGQDSIERSRENSYNLWQKLYKNDGRTTSICANSLWLDQKLGYNQQTVDILKNKYFASTFAGDFTSDGYSQAMRNWLNEQTGNMLKDSVQSLKFDQNTIMALASTLYFKAQWHDEFSEENTTTGVFRSSSGDTEVEYLNRYMFRAKYCWSENFSAIELPFEDGGTMLFILPDEGHTVGDVLKNDDVYQLISDGDNFENHSYPSVELSVPKFDVTSDLKIEEDLKKLGVEKMFGTDADFSPICTESDAWVSSICQSTRIMIDEKGCEGASFVMASMSGSSPPDDEIEFTVDRPFIMVVSGEDGIPRFAGVINHP